MTTFRGFNACTCLVKWLPVFERELLRRGVIKHNIDIAQLVGGYSKSGGTHLPGGAFDIWQNTRLTIEIAREMGAAAWGRTRAQGFDPHAHGVLKGCPHNAGGRYQITELENGGDGLVGNRPDDGPRTMPIPLRTWQEGIKWAEAKQPKPFGIRVGTYNLPDATKLPKVAARIEVAAELVDQAKLDVLGLNELVGRRSEGHPSSHALKVRDAIKEATGVNWKLVTPKGKGGALNENYALVRDATVQLASQWGDAVLRPAGVPGRHLTRMVLRHRATRRKFGFGVTHLVNDNRPGAQKQGKLVAAGMAGIGKTHDCPLIVVGDMNDDNDIKGLTGAGFVNTRKKAKATTNAGYATYTGYDKTRPSTNTEWRIDQIYAKGEGMTVAGQTLILGTRNGVFIEPRPTEHGLLVASLTFK